MRPQTFWRANVIILELIFHILYIESRNNIVWVVKQYCLTNQTQVFDGWNNIVWSVKEKCFVWIKQKWMGNKEGKCKLDLTFTRWFARFSKSTRELKTSNQENMEGKRRFCLPECQRQQNGQPALPVPVGWPCTDQSRKCAGSFAFSYIGWCVHPMIPLI